MEIISILLTRINSALLDFRKYLRFNHGYNGDVERMVESMLECSLKLAEHFERQGVIPPDEVIEQAGNITEDVGQKLNEQVKRLEYTLSIVDSQLEDIRKRRARLKESNKKLRKEIEKVKV